MFGILQMWPVLAAIVDDVEFRKKLWSDEVLVTEKIIPED